MTLFVRPSFVLGVRHFAALSLLLAAWLISGSAFAQATRTWVSGVGDDVNPCSRTAPCKTYAGAISKTATGGEISTLDPAGFGALTIIKSITIDGNKGNIGSILFSGTNGININAAGAIVVLRNLELNGAGTTRGMNGIRIIKAGKVFIENVRITTASNTGIMIDSGAAATVFVDRSSMFDVNGTPVDGSAAIQVLDAASTVYVSDTTIFGNQMAFSTSADGNPPSGGKIISFNNNRIEGNTQSSAPTSVVYGR